MKTIITIQHTQSVHHTNGMVGSCNLLKLQSKEYDNSYIIIDLTADRLALKPTYDSQYKTVEFDRVV